MRADAAHAKRDDTDPSGAIESIELQTLGISGRIKSGTTGQCRNSRSCQRMAITQGLDGSGQGL